MQTDERRSLHDGHDIHIKGGLAKAADLVFAPKKNIGCVIADTKSNAACHSEPQVHRVLWEQLQNDSGTWQHFAPPFSLDLSCSD